MKIDRWLNKTEYITLFTIITLCILPILIRIVPTEYHYFESLLFPKGMEYNIFGYFKARTFMVVTMMMLLVSARKVLDKATWREYKLLYIKSALLGFIVFLSSIKSEFSYLTFWGSNEGQVGFWFFLSLILYTVIIAVGMKTKEELEKVKLYFVCLSIIPVAVGLLQIFNVQILDGALIKRLIVPNNIDGTQSFFLNNGMAYSFFGNPNYFSIYCVVLFTVLYGMVKFEKTKILETAYFGFMLFITLISLVGTNSIVGIGSIFVSLFIYQVIEQNSKQKFIKVIFTSLLWFPVYLIKIPYKAINSPVVLLVISIIIIMVGLVFNYLVYNSKKKIAVTLIVTGLILTMVLFLTNNKEKQITKVVDNISIVGNTLKISSENESLDIKINSEGSLEIEAEHEGEEEVIYRGYDNSYIIKNGYFGEMFFVPVTSDKGVFYNIWEYNVKFGMLENQMYFVDKYGFLSADFQRPQLLFNENLDSFGSGRGYIWNRSIPITLKTLVMGRGFGTFSYYFPQDDHVGRINAGVSSIIIDKPHNMYIQMTFAGGIIAIVLYMLIILYPIWQLIYSDLFFENILIFKVEIAVISVYLFMMLFNDMTVSINLVFHSLLGMTYAKVRLYSVEKVKKG